MNRVTDITVCHITHIIDSCQECMIHDTFMNDSGQHPYFAHVLTLLRRSRALLNISRLFFVCRAQRVGFFRTCVSSCAHAWALLRISRGFLYVCTAHIAAYTGLFDMCLRALWHAFKTVWNTRSLYCVCAVHIAAYASLFSIRVGSFAYA